MTERLALIVDDNPTNRLLACTLLKKRGWRTMEVDSGESALSLAKNTFFELVLLDISMPGLSGEETCVGLRQLPSGSAMRIIAYTAHAFPEERKRFLATGFDDILVKPLNRQHFETLLAKL
jgi:CheY-like chemotaxis protein